MGLIFKVNIKMNIFLLTLVLKHLSDVIDQLAQSKFSDFKIKLVCLNFCKIYDIFNQKQKLFAGNQNNTRKFFTNLFVCSLLWSNFTFNNFSSLLNNVQRSSQLMRNWVKKHALKLIDCLLLFKISN